MLIAGITDTPYRILYLLHILSVVVAFAPAVIHPLAAKAVAGDPGALRIFLADAYRRGHRIHGPALVFTGLFGIGMIVMSDDAWSFSDAWVSAAFTVWFLITGVVFGMLLPAEKKWSEGDASAKRIVDIAGPVTTLLFLVMLFLMIWKPGAA